LKKYTLIVLVSFVALMAATPSFSQSSESVVPQTREDIKMSFAPIVKHVAPSVINIYTKRMVTRNVSPFMNDPFFSQFFGRGMGLPQQRLEGSLGSGVIVDASGLAVTNAHVIRDAQEITVALTDGREFPARVILQDDASDLALVKIDAPDVTLPAATLKSSESLEVGDLVLAIGNPFGVGQTVTSGIISALARSSLNINDINFFIQTDAAINPGNSGGPLVAMDGSVIGINSAIYSRDGGGSLGIGFAIPSEMVVTVLAAQKSGQVSKNGEIIRPWVGVIAQDVTSDIAQSMGLAAPKGALLSNLHEGSPALEAGLKQGDVVTGVNDHAVADAAEMRFRLATIPMGSEARITYMRDGKTQTTALKSIAPPDLPAREAEKISGKNPLSGATLVRINPAVEVELGLKNTPPKGVVVAEIEPNSIAQRVVRAGDVVLGINGVSIASPKDALAALKKPTPQGFILTLLSNGQQRQIIIR